MLEIESVLSLFSLLALSSGVYFAAKRLKVPYTVLLVLVGLLIVPIVHVPVLKDIFGFLGELTLTPELLFFIFLPILIFESAFNMNVRRMVDNIWSISLLAVVGLLLSTVAIAALLFFALPYVGIPIPFIVALLFGAIISSTDPVAVLALFKEFGAPKRLTMIFEGESLFNDGTAVALFLVILAVIEHGFNGSSTVVEGVLMFGGMVIFGIIFGLLMATLFSRALRFTKSNEFVTVTLLLISAHIVFIVSEIINEKGLFGLDIHISSIIATTIAALFLGNYSRHTLSPKTDEYLGKVTEHIAFMANSLVFLLAGLLFASSKIDVLSLILPILLTILVVAFVRAVTIFVVILPLNALKIEEKIPRSWQLLLAWGSLRGALAIIIVLLIPETVTVPGWTLDYSVRDLLLALTVGCILATLFVKAPLIGSIVRKLKINQPEPIVEAYEADLGVYYLLTAESRFDTHKTRGFVRESEYVELKKDMKAKLDHAYSQRDDLIKAHGKKVFEQSLHLTAIQVEEFTLKQLYANEEVSESIFRKIKGKLNLQKEKIEYAQEDTIDPSKYIDRKDVFDRLVNALQTLYDRKRSNKLLPEEQLQYYRAQMIISRKVTKVLNDMQHEHPHPVFIPEVFEKVLQRYESYRAQCSARVDSLLAAHNDELSPYLASLATRSLNASGVRALGYLNSRGILSEDVEHNIEQKFGIEAK
ncbi:MAG: sodium:proton antiporter [Candidatus Saccharimonadales bacterium]